MSAFPLSRRRFLTATAAGFAGAASPLFGQENKPADRRTVEETVEHGLNYLKRVQAQDGHWAANSEAYRVAMTALGGMSFLMEGSSLKEGKYSDQIKKAVDWFLMPQRQQPNGLIADRSASGDFGSYIHGHGFATMFLACAYGEAEDKEQQQNLERAVRKAVEFTCKAQTSKKHRLAEGKTVEVGGWGYVSAADGRNFDEGSTTVTQVQALRAARNAAIAVPKETIQKATDYLEACTTPKGGVIYSYAGADGVARNGEERPPITAAAVACAFGAGQYKSELAKRWVKFCKENIPIAKGRIAHDEYQNYYFAQFVYVLGDERYGEMFPKEDKATRLTWSKYKAEMYPYLIDQQNKSSGEWSSGHVGPVFSTAVNLTILQLEKGILPIYQR